MRHRPATNRSPPGGGPWSRQTARPASCGALSREFQPIWPLAFRSGNHCRRRRRTRAAPFPRRPSLPSLAWAVTSASPNPTVRGGRPADPGSRRSRVEAVLRPYDGDALSAVRPAGHRRPAWRGLRACVRLIILGLRFDAHCERLQRTTSQSLPQVRVSPVPTNAVRVAQPWRRCAWWAGRRWSGVWTDGAISWYVRCVSSSATMLTHLNEPGGGGQREEGVSHGALRMLLSSLLDHDAVGDARVGMERYKALRPFPRRAVHHLEPAEHLPRLIHRL